MDCQLRGLSWPLAAPPPAAQHLTACRPSTLPGHPGPERQPRQVCWLLLPLVGQTLAQVRAHLQLSWPHTPEAPPKPPPNPNDPPRAPFCLVRRRRASSARPLTQRSVCVEGGRGGRVGAGAAGRCLRSWAVLGPVPEGNSVRLGVQESPSVRKSPQRIWCVRFGGQRLPSFPPRCGDSQSPGPPEPLTPALGKVTAK